MNTTNVDALPLRVDGLPDDWVMAESAFVDFRLRPKPDRPGKYDKLPINPHTGTFAMANKPATWGRLDQAVAGIAAHQCHGISLMLAKRWQIVAVDLDGCRDRDTGTVDPWALDIVASFAPCYWGPSVSGTGLRILVRGTIPAGHNDQERGIEIYDHARQMTLTGHLGADAIRTIEPRQEAIDAFLAEYFPAPEPQPARVPPQPIDLDDTTLIDRARRNDAFDRLWRGDMTDAGNNGSQADYRLAFRLIFWTQGDEGRTERLMRASGLARAKWDERRADSTWLRRHCIAPAVTNQRTYYDPLRPHQMPAEHLPGGDQGTAPPPTEMPQDTPPDTDTGDLLTAYRAMDHDELARLAVELHQTVSAQQRTMAEDGRRRRAATEMLANVMQVRRNPHIKTERDTLVAVTLAYDAAPKDDEGYARLPLQSLGDAVGKKTDAIGKHLTRGQSWGLLDKKLVTDRFLDADTGEVILKPTTRVKLLATPAQTLRTLVTIAPEPATKGGNTWGGKRVSCPKCGSERKTVSVHCADCGTLLDQRDIDAPPVSSKMRHTGNAPRLVVADAPAVASACIQQDAAYSKFPVPTPCTNQDNPLYRCDQTVTESGNPFCTACVIAGWDRSEPAPPADLVSEDEADEADDWDRYKCNAPSCRRRLDPALGKRFCWQHRHIGLAPPASRSGATPPATLARCGASSCVHRVDRAGDRYCGRCVAAGEGYSNAPPPLLTGHAYVPVTAGDD